MAKKILFIDNDQDFLDTRVEKLSKEGYEVLEAVSIENAEQILERNWIHVAIIDVRMRDENDGKDTSGLSFAKKKIYESIPKIILTGYPSFEYVREALGPALEGMPPAVDFLSKQEGWEAMLHAVEQAFAKHIRINWDLQIVWTDLKSSSFPHLVSLIEPQPIGALLPDRVDEIEDLFRKLFYDYEQVTLSRILWQKDGRVSMDVQAYAKSREAQFVVTCGHASVIHAELERYHSVAPKTHVVGIPLLIQVAENRHYAAVAWSLPGQDITETRSLARFSRESTDRKVTTALENLFQTTLGHWHKQLCAGESDKNLTRSYLECLRIEEPDKLGLLTKAASLLEALAKEASSCRLVEISTTHDQIVFRFSNGKVATYTNPFLLLTKDEFVFMPRPTLCTALGHLSVNNIIVGYNGQAWVTDFACAGTALPVWQDFISLEASIRFNLMDKRDLYATYEFEKQLLAVNCLGEAVSAVDIEPEYRQAFSMIQTIRRYAAQVAGDDLAPYYLGLLFNIVKGMESYDLNICRPRQEVITWVHHLLLASMLGEKIDREEPFLGADRLGAKAVGIQIDEINHEIRVQGRKVNLTPTEFNLLVYLHHNANQLCKRQDIVRDVFGYSNADRDAEKSLLNTNIERLRSKIEADPSHPEYILTIRGHGYKLVVELAL